ncbi:MAG: DUF1559 domain-containing protein [Planctomycetaceae bacterium]|nr:DUF1559 domain-containing protein [Planctomycetaceae bacterium]MBV8267541.1 DUF1559 domain-containing protein [Planctomycetaceae bacterium]MBV8315213.1 DUF1559 domain-containing protein [Planctomycetaceae bacterium]MBV8555324.1 DUF1559 domain-containing protein [Planctomycetaceae bacterium]MBV8676999.1 DUF1559 domain-containing protein [Planctomycetaceae bacterium]
MPMQSSRATRPALPPSGFTLIQRLARQDLAHRRGTDQFNPSPEECWTQVLGPAGLEDGLRTINNPEAHVEDYWSRHPGGANFLFVDGLVHFLKSTINPLPWPALATRAGGEVISSDQC